MNQTIQNIFNGIIEGNRSVVKEKIMQAINDGVDPAIILNAGMIEAMAEVGRRFECGEYYVPEMLIAARAMQEGLAILKPYLAQADVPSAGKIIIGTVSGDLHDIGKNLVAMMLEGAGFEIIDLGTDVSPERFVEAVRSNDADLVAMSALLTTTMPNMRTTLAAIEAAGLRANVKVIVGGAPLTEGFAQQIAADGYAPDASRAVTLAKSLASKRI
jgi:5-methyltetrahydrofolate--homocysteine methyltransferase